MMKKLRYFFYRVYSWQLKRYGQVSAPEGAAQLAILFLFIINILTIRGILQIFTGIDIDPILFFSKSTIVCIEFILLFVSYLIIRRTQFCNKLVKEFSFETQRERLKGTIFIWSYTIGSILALFLSAYMSRYAHEAAFTVIGYLR